MAKYALEYYKDIPKGTKVTADDNISEERWDKICYTAESDVVNRNPKKKESDFKSNGEYKLYLLSVYSAAKRAERGLL